MGCNFCCLKQKEDQNTSTKSNKHKKSKVIYFKRPKLMQNVTHVNKQAILTVLQRTIEKNKEPICRMKGVGNDSVIIETKSIDFDKTCSCKNKVAKRQTSGSGMTSYDSSDLAKSDFNSDIRRDQPCHQCRSKRSDRSAHDSIKEKATERVDKLIDQLNVITPQSYYA